MKKNNKRKIDEESLQLYGLFENATGKLMNQISNFEELELEKSLNEAGKMDLKVRGPCNTERYCQPPWLADKKNF